MLGCFRSDTEREATCQLRAALVAEALRPNVMACLIRNTALSARTTTDVDPSGWMNSKKVPRGACVRGGVGRGREKRDREEKAGKARCLVEASIRSGYAYTKAL